MIAYSLPTENALSMPGSTISYFPAMTIDTAFFYSGMVTITSFTYRIIFLIAPVSKGT